MTHRVSIPKYFKDSNGEPLKFEHKRHAKYFTVCLKKWPWQAQKEDVSRMVCKVFNIYVCVFDLYNVLYKQK